MEARSVDGHQARDDHGGQATWEGQDLNACQRFIDTWGLGAFLKEAQHKVKERAEGTALRFKPATVPLGHYVDMTDDEVTSAIQTSSVRVFAGIDFGAWRFAFTLWMVDRNAIVTRIDELFSQPLTAAERAMGTDHDRPANSLTARAQLIHEMCAFYGIDRAPIWGDAANPQDILEINAAFRRGWEVVQRNGQPLHVKSKLRVVAVMNENKSRRVGVERINNALDHNQLRFRREIAYEWRYGMNAGSEGTVQHSSRLMWEIDSWSFPVPKEGEAQDQNPDDHTADGSDMCASMRYALLSHWRAAKAPVEHGTYEDDRTESYDYRARKFREPRHAVDIFSDASPGRRTPRVSAPRPKIFARNRIPDDDIL